MGVEVQIRPDLCGSDETFGFLRKATMVDNVGEGVTDGVAPALSII